MILCAVLSVASLFTGTLHTAGSGAIHPDSMSRTRVVVAGREAHVTIRLQTLSVVEVMPRLDLDRDGELSAAELEAASEAIGGYVLSCWGLFVGPDTGERLDGRVDSLRLLERDSESAFALRWMEATLVFEAEGELESFAIESRLFTTDDPYHRDFVSVFWHDEPEVRVLLRSGRERFVFEPAGVRRPGVFLFFARLGFEHILEGTDHLAFLLMLLVAAPRFRSLVGIVTAFTLAHSITLAFASLDPEGLLGRIPSRFVELAIALSIAYVACENLLRPETRVAWMEAFGFGLLHGLGFAGFLGGALAGESLVVTALFGFNIGVEIGQLIVVCALAFLFFIAQKRRRLVATPASDDNALRASGLVSGPTRKIASGVVAVISLYWFVERAGWI